MSGGCGSFYAITIASEAFKGLPTIKQHRLVNEVLKEDIEGIHGLQVRIRRFGLVHHFIRELSCLGPWLTPPRLKLKTIPQ